MTRAAIRIQDPLAFQEISDALARVLEAPRDGTDERGAIYTKREVVDFILDLAGYSPDQPLFTRRVLEPSFGDGDFLLPIVDRLFTSWKNRHKGKIPRFADLSACICAVELHAKTYESTKARVCEYLESHGLSSPDAHQLAAAWLHRGDYLLLPLDTGIDLVVGNPPYVRQELIPAELMTEYRRLYLTVFDRADLYIPFIERSLTLLKRDGVLAFICSDRWMKNRYGGPLRKLVADGFHLKYFVDMGNTAAFHSDVIAYPAIFVIAASCGVKTRVARNPEISADNLGMLASALAATDAKRTAGVQEVTGVACGEDPWILDSLGRLEVIRRLETTFPLLEETGSSVRIGVATGADKVFIGKYDELDVEPERKLPLVMTRDILTGEVKWRGFGVLNPFDDNGRLVSLDAFPKFAKYLEVHGKEIRERHVAVKNPTGWYRTIDRIYPEYATRPKLLIPDIKGEAHVVYEEGRLYPHHNLYYIVSDKWPLRALQAVLRSYVTRAFIALYSTRMRGGYLRYQAQYLRRIRVPPWDVVPAPLRKTLMRAGEGGDLEACDEAARALYGLTSEESKLLQEK